MQLDHGAAIVNLLTVLVFVLFQCAFFVFVAALEIDVTVQKKGNLLQRLRNLLQNKNEHNLVAVLDAQVRQQEGDGVAEAQAEAALATKENRKLLLLWMLPPVLVLLGAVGVVFFLGYRSQPAEERSVAAVLKSHDRLGLGLLALAYVAEILFFVLVIRRHVHLGDIALAKQMWSGCE